jgi:4-amino-4-deoxy-L-arabinose transferase-like glycosyltransferase
MARHLWGSLLYYDSWQHHNIMPFLQDYHYYPPLLYWLTAPFYTLFGTGVTSAVAVNAIFIPILAFSVYELGRRSWGRAVGLASAVTIMSYPILVTQFKEFQLDAPLTAMAALALLLLTMSREFQNRLVAVGFGVACGLGMLTKWTFIYIIAAPLLVAVIGMAVRWWRHRSWLPPLNLALAGVATYVVSSVWYITNFQQLRIDLLANGGTQQAAIEGDPLVGTWASHLWYPEALINHHMFLGLAVLLIFGLGLSFYRYRWLVKNRYYIASIVGIYLLFTATSNKDVRYIMPLLPAAAIMTWWWLSLLRRRAQLIALSIIGLMAVITFATISFGSTLWPKNVTLNILDKHPLTIFAQRGYIIGPATHEQWRLQSVFEKVATESQPSLAYHGTETIWLNGWDLTYYSQRYRVRMSNNPTTATYLLVRGDQPQLDTSGHLLEHSWELPDGSSLRLYKNTALGLMQ